MIRNSIFLAMTLLVAACGTTNSLFKPSELDATKISTNQKKVTVEDLQSGFKLYSSNCTGCHYIYVPASKNKLEWEKTFLVMFPKTHMNSEEQELVRQYIFSKL